MSVIRLHSHSTNTWLRINQPRPQARLRLFCFPYAGGAASLYRTWPQHLPPTIELCAVQLPGRENRIRESPYTNLVDLVAALLPNLLPVLDKPFALFGHSMGALIAYEVARQLQQHRQIPTHLLVSGRRAPVLPEPEALLHTLPSDEAFLRELHRRYHNIPTVLFEETELRALFVPLLRADLTLVETYQCTQLLPLPCQLVALGGTDDPRVAPHELQAWQVLTQADFASHRFPGGHFYLNEQVQPLLATIAGYLA
jgi:medium-chain acyl-[acyl-carrier-protein] hydrolase